MYKKIIVPLDGSELAECVIPHVESVAKGCETPEVIFLHVVHRPETSWSYTYLDKEDIRKFMSEDATKSREESMKYMDKIVADAGNNGLKARSEVLVGDPAEIIADYAGKEGADLIVIATHGRSGVSRWTYGSVADRVLRSSCIPVLMVRAPGCVPGL